MPITLAVIAGLALLLPGLVGIAFSNLRARRSAASRPELQLTAVSVIAVVIGVSLVAHLITYFIVSTGLSFGPALGHAVPSANRLSPIFANLFYDHGQLRPVWPNPFDLMVRIAAGGSASASSLVIVGVLLAFETIIVVSLITDEGVDLFFDGVDLANQGWVFEHITRPAQNGYGPIAYVLTTVQKDGLGIGYKGLVGDIRQSEKGETLALSLNEPERFLYEIKPAVAGATGAVGLPSFQRYSDEYIGGVVALDAKVILNIVISNPSVDLVAEISAAAEAFEAPLRPLPEPEQR